MQATPSHVTPEATSVSDAAFPADLGDELYSNDLLPELKLAAAASRRSHILISRRKRGSRRSIR